MGWSCSGPCRRSVYHQAESREAHPAIVICPGGGYGHLALDHEGHQIAAWLGTLGITGVILDYRHRGKGYGHPIPLLDVQRAVRYVRARSDEWKIDPERIGVLGFSAGGHLASSVSVHHDNGDPAAADPIDRRSCRPSSSGYGAAAVPRAMSLRFVLPGRLQSLSLHFWWKRVGRAAVCCANTLFYWTHPPLHRQLRHSLHRR